MTIVQALVLGIVQGATEFLPVSSSGHLVLVPHLLGWRLPEEQVFIFDVLVQLGTLLAVILYFWPDLWAIARSTLGALRHPDLRRRPETRLGVHILIATLPAVVLGLLFKDAVEAAFASPTATAWFLLGTAVLLFIAERVGRQSKSLEDATWLDALWVGFFQALALFPGVSRSGSTITGGMTRQLGRPAAARFSFLIAVPVMLGAGLLAALDLLRLPNLAAFAGPMAVGFLSSALVGYAAIRWLLHYLANHPLTNFSMYLVVVALLALLFG